MDIQHTSTYEHFTTKHNPTIYNVQGVLKKFHLWCKHLLANINFLEDKEELCHLLQADKMLYLVTDGGETAGIGYYRWVTATVCDILIEAK
eukprot:13773303-Ditylum_brightwellii.AAC.1